MTQNRQVPMPPVAPAPQEKPQPVVGQEGIPLHLVLGTIGALALAGLMAPKVLELISPDQTLREVIKLGSSDSGIGTFARSVAR